MKLEGSCHCQAVRFELQSSHPYPFNLCYCSICRKTGGGGGYAINLGGNYDTLKIRGKESIHVYQATTRDAGESKVYKSPAERSFCGKCGSALWVWDPRWPELVHPFASAIDSKLPKPPERTHLMLQFKAPWVVTHVDPKDKEFPLYPNESIADWHDRLRLSDN